ncbi:hypothetical protein [Roseobacter litoralis]|uniref:hypothetical protein n=1 Tax=Roseobacter litoralis TaxID=42443 RepID=UPI002494697B|nr:hypothetical protein [Roseobacter litoralis]
MLSESERLLAALNIAAQIVGRDGEAFLPIFMRLESEVQGLELQASALERAKGMSRGRAA